MPSLVFGSPLPHSLLAKAAAYRLEAGESLIRLLQHYATPFLEQNLLGSGAAVAIGLLLYPFLFLLALRRVARTRPRPPLALWVWALYPWLYLVTFAIPNPLIFRWYLTPPLPAYFFFIFIGLDALFVSIWELPLPPHCTAGAWVMADRALLNPPGPQGGCGAWPLLTALRQRDTRGTSAGRARGRGVNLFGVFGDIRRQKPLKNVPPPIERGLGGGDLKRVLH